MNRSVNLLSLVATLSFGTASVGALAQDTVLPTFANAYEPLGLDERGLWQQMDEYEREFALSPAVYKAPKLKNYLKEILCKTVGPDRCGATRIYIVRDTNFNATMTPNGVMSVHTGLLLRLRNEAELASVLGHEFAHFEKRHSLNGFKRRRRGTDLVSWMSIAAGTAATFGGSQSHHHYRDFRTTIYGDIYRYKRDQERESDVLSVQYLIRSPYPSRAGAQVWLRLMDEDAEQARERKRGKRRKLTGWADSHPSQFERAGYLSQIAEAASDDGDYHSESYMKAIEPHLPVFFDDQLQRNDFAATKYLMEQLAVDGWTPNLLFFQGELYRLRGNPRDLVTATTAYSNAIEAGFNGPNAWRGLGLSQLRLGSETQGKEALQTYLEMAPEASDAAMITMLVGGEN